MKKDKIYEFCVYSCIGVTYDDTPQMVISRIIDRAYRDATSHVLRKISNEAKKTKYRTNASKDIYKAVCGSIKDYNKWHEDLCRKIQQHYPKTSTFSYGIAQKWVNMTVKYLYLYSIVSNNKNVSGLINDLLLHIDDYHAPIDSYVLKALGDNESWSKDIKTAKDYIAKRELIPTNYVESNELEWEMNTWLNEAKKYRKKKTYEE